MFMGKPINLFKVFGFQIRLDLSWFLIVFVLAWSLAVGLFPAEYPGLTPGAYWGMGITGALGLFACVLLHELGHAVVAQRFGVKMRGITLFIFGGVAEMGDEPPNPKAEFWVAVGGPLVTVVLIGVFWLLLRLVQWPAVVEGVIGYLAMINLVLLVFNMVPAFPLDGGRVLRSALWAWKRDLRWATYISSRIGAGFAAVLMGLAVYRLFMGDMIGAIWSFILGMFLRNAALGTYQQLVARQALEHEPVSRFMNAEPITVAPDLTIDRFVDDYVYKHQHRSFPVVEGERLLGCISTDDVKDLPRDQWPQRTVAELAQPCDARNTIGVHEDAYQAVRKMGQNQRTRLLVVDRDRLVGILSMRDLLGALQLRLELEGDMKPHAA